METLHSAGRLNKNPRRQLLSTTIKTAALLLLGTLGVNVLQAQNCEFAEVDTSQVNWEVIDGKNHAIFYENDNTATTASIPDFTSTGCDDAANVVLALFDDTDTRFTSTGATDLLTRGTGANAVNSAVTVDLPLSLTGELITYTPAADTAWGAAPKKYVIKAAAAFGDVQATFEFYVTVLPERLDPPTAVIAHAESTESIVVTWTGDGANDADNYEVLWSDASGMGGSSGLIQEKTPTTETAHSYSIQGLNANTEYTVSVRSVVPGVATDTYDDRFSPGATATTDAAQRTTFTPPYTDASPVRIAIGASVNLNAADWIDPASEHDTNFGNTQGTTTFTYSVRSGNNSALRVQFIDDGDAIDTDHVIRLTGLAKASTYAKVEAKNADGTVVLQATIPVSVATNAREIFSITSATVRWDIAESDAADFEIDAADFAAQQDAGVTLTYTMTGGEYRGVSYLEIANDGTISVPTGTNLGPLESGVEFELTVTATDNNQYTDTLTIYVDVVDGDDAPIRQANVGDIWLKPIALASGGGSRSVNVAKYFTDPEGDRLCYKITSRTTNKGSATDPINVAKATLSGAQRCMSSTLTVTMNLPSTDPNSDGFALLGRNQVDEVEVQVAAFQEGDSSNESDPVTVKVKLAFFNNNSPPSIREIAKITGSSTFVSTRAHEVTEGDPIRLTFTADDAQTGPNSGVNTDDDELCWSYKGKCVPCQGPSNTTRRVAGTVSHEYELEIPGKDVDYEKNRDGFGIEVCATDLSGATDRLYFVVNIKNREEPPSFNDIDDLYFVVGDYAQDVDLTDFIEDGDGVRDIVDYDANIVGSSTAVTVREDDGIVTVTPTESTLSRKAEVDIEVSATDSSGHRAYAYFTAHVKNDNRSPFFSGGLGSVTYSVAENTRAKTKIGAPIDAEDPDAGDVVKFELSGSDMFGIESTSTGAQLMLAKSGLDYERGRRHFNLVLTASDGYGGADSLRVNIRVTDVNEPPVATDEVIPDQRILLGMTECVVKASDHFMDPDESDQSAGLLIEATSTRPGDVVVSVRNNDDVCIRGKNVGTGPARITITAEDRDGRSAVKRFRASVEQNNPPVTAATGALPDIEVQLDGRSEDIDLLSYFDDGDDTYDETLEFETRVEDTNVATAAVVRGTYLRVYGNDDGTTTVTVTATDQNRQSHSQKFEVRVIRNDPPVANQNAIANVSTRVGQTPDQIYAGDAFEDEGDSFTLSVGTDDADVATISVSFDEDGNPWITVLVHSVGSTRATLTAIDTAQNTSTVSFQINVGERNDPPVLTNPIADMSVGVDLRVDVEMDGVFEDEGDLDFDVEIEDDNVADVIYRSSSNILRVYGYRAGDTNVTVTATDDIGQTATDEFVVNVVVGNPPVVNAVPVAPTVSSGGTTQMSLVGVFSDPDGDALSYTASSSDDSIAKVAVTGNTLEITGVAEGTVAITIKAADTNGLTVDVSIDVTVGPADTAPVLAIPFNDLTLEQGKHADVTLDGAFEDDGNLTYTISFDDEDVAHGVYRSGTNTIRIYGDMLGTTTATVTAIDDSGQTVSDSFEVMVIEPNLPPMVVQEIEGTTIEADSHIDISLDGVFVDEGDLTYTVSSEDEEIAEVLYRASRNSVRVYGISVGTVTITVIATDDIGQAARTTFEMVIEPANDPPTLSGTLDDQVVTIGTPSIISVAAAFSDPDGDDLSYTATSSDTAIATVAMSGADLTTTGVSAGSATITVTATDPGGLSASGTFNVDVETAPMLVSEFDDEIVTAGEPVTLTVGKYFTDEDGDTLTYSAMSSDDAVAMVSVSGEELTIDGMSAGTATITVTASDPKGRSASGSFEVNVETAPMLVMEFDDRVVTAGMPDTFSVASNFADEDGDMLTYSAMSSDDAVATVSVSGENLTIDGMSAGTAMITVTASDPKGRSAMGTFDVVVETAPMLVLEFDDQVVTAGEPLTLQVAKHFTDEDGDTLTYSASSSDTAIAMVSVSGEDVTVNGVAAGMATITVTASDPKDRSVSGTFGLVVETAPEAVGSIADMMLQVGGDAMDMDLTSYFADGDGDTLTYAASTDTNAVETAVDGAMLTLTPHTKGQSVVVVTASDPKQREATQQFTVTVDDGGIKAVGNDALAGVARTVIGSASNAVGARLEGNRGNTAQMDFLPIIGGRDQFERVQSQPGVISAKAGAVGPAPRTQQPVQRTPAPTLRKASTGVSWGVVPGRFQEAPQSRKVDIASMLGNNFSYFLNGNGGLGSFSGWGTVDFRNFEGEGYDGNASAFFLGLDVKVSPYVLLGAAVGHNRSESDYSYGSATQTLETTVTSVLPYVSYKPNPRAIVWGVVGRGAGEATTTVHNADSESSDLTMNLGMFGASARFASRGATQFGIRGDAAFAGLATEDGNGAADDLDAGVNRLRIGAEAMHVFGMADGSTVTPYGEVNLRYDGGDGVTGSGLELAGGVRIMANAFSLDARGHTVAAHSAEDFSESGVTLMATLNPSHGMTGLSMSLAPSWGSTSRSQSLVWADSATGSLPFNTGFGSQNGFAMNANIGYGFLINRDRHLMKPYLEYGEGASNQSILLGTEVKQLIVSSSVIDMNVMVGRVGSMSDSDNNLLEINATLQF